MASPNMTIAFVCSHGAGKNGGRYSLLENMQRRLDYFILAGIRFILNVYDWIVLVGRKKTAVALAEL